MYGDVLKDCGSTTNLFNVNTSFVLTIFVLLYRIQHLKLKHPSESKVVEDLKREEKTKHKRPKLNEPANQPTLEQVIRRTQKYNKTSPHQKSLDDCLLEIIVLDMQPASIVEDPGFQDL